MAGMKKLKSLFTTQKARDFQTIDLMSQGRLLVKAAQSGNWEGLKNYQKKNKLFQFSGVIPYNCYQEILFHMIVNGQYDLFCQWLDIEHEVCMEGKPPDFMYDLMTIIVLRSEDERFWSKIAPNLSLQDVQKLDGHITHVKNEATQARWSKVYEKWKTQWHKEELECEQEFQSLLQKLKPPVYVYKIGITITT